MKEVRDGFQRMITEHKNEHKLASLVNPHIQRIEYVYNKYKDITGKSMHPTAPPPVAKQFVPQMPGDAGRLMFQLSGPSATIQSGFPVSLITPQMMPIPPASIPVQPMIQTAPPVISFGLKPPTEASNVIDVDDEVDNVFERPTKRQRT